MKIVKKLMRYLGMAVVLAVSAGVHAEGWDEAFYERRGVKFLEAATDWVIEDGISTYYQAGREGVRRKLFEQWGYIVDLIGSEMPYVDYQNYLAWFRLRAGDGNNIINLYRERLAGGIYEFWIVKVGANYGSSDTDRCIFYLTRADEVRGPRVILRRSNRFIARFEVASGVSFDFPVDDMEVVSKLDAWRYPESYPDSDLKNLKVSKDGFTGRITVERGDGEEWAYEQDRDGNLMMLSETIHATRRALRAGSTISESEWEEFYDGLVGILNQGQRPIKEKDWRRYYKRWFDKLERLDKTAAKTRFDAKERLNIEWEDKQ